MAWMCNDHARIRERRGKGGTRNEWKGGRPRSCRKSPRRPHCQNHRRGAISAPLFFPSFRSATVTIAGYLVHKGGKVFQPSSPSICMYSTHGEGNEWPASMRGHRAEIEHKQRIVTVLSSPQPPASTDCKRRVNDGAPPDHPQPQ